MANMRVRDKATQPFVNPSVCTDDRTGVSNFKKLITDIADSLNSDDVEKLAYQREIKSAPSSTGNALNLLKQMEKNGEFDQSLPGLYRLKALLNDIPRSDIVNRKVDPYIMNNFPGGKRSSAIGIHRPDQLLIDREQSVGEAAAANSSFRPQQESSGQVDSVVTVSPQSLHLTNRLMENASSSPAYVVDSLPQQGGRVSAHLGPTMIAVGEDQNGTIFYQESAIPLVSTPGPGSMSSYSSTQELMLHGSPSFASISSSASEMSNLNLHKTKRQPFPRHSQQDQHNQSSRLAGSSTDDGIVLGYYSDVEHGLSGSPIFRSNTYNPAMMARGRHAHYRRLLSFPNDRSWTPPANLSAMSRVHSNDDHHYRHQRSLTSSNSGDNVGRLTLLSASGHALQQFGYEQAQLESGSSTSSLSIQKNLEPVKFTSTHQVESATKSVTSPVIKPKQASAFSQVKETGSIKSRDSDDTLPTSESYRSSMYSTKGSQENLEQSNPDVQAAPQKTSKGASKKSLIHKLPLKKSKLVKELRWNIKRNTLNKAIYKHKIEKMIACPTKLELDASKGKDNPKLVLNLYPYGLDADYQQNVTLHVLIEVSKKMNPKLDIALSSESAKVKLTMTVFDPIAEKTMETHRVEKPMNIRGFHIFRFISHEDLRSSKSDLIEISAHAELVLPRD